MLRVLHVIGAMDRAGSETFLMNVYRTIDRTKVQFDFLVHQERDCDYDDEIRSLGGTIYRLPSFLVINSIPYRKACRDFFAEHHDYAVVHGHIGSCAAIYLEEAKRFGMYTVAHSHSQGSSLSPTELVFRALSHKTRFVADYFMACSYEAGLERYGRAVVEGERFSIINNGIDARRYEYDEDARCRIRAELGIGDEPVFGHVGRLAPEKNHLFLLDVFEVVKRSLPEAKLVLCGRGPNEAQVKEKAASMGLADSVSFLGVRDDVPTVLNAFDVFVFPSHYEGLGMAAVEAQASGLRVVASTGLPTLSVMSDRMVRLPLENGPELWARACLEAYRARDGRSGGSSVVAQAGFDIATTASLLQEFYLRTNR